MYNFFQFSRKLIVEFGTAIGRGSMVPDDHIRSYIIVNQYLEHISAILREIIDHAEDIHPEIAGDKSVYPLILAVEANQRQYTPASLDGCNYFDLLDSLVFVTQDEIKIHAEEEDMDEDITKTGFTRLLRLYLYDPLFRKCVDNCTAERLLEFLSLLEKVCGCSDDDDE
jgi:hypothetical protein